MASHGFQNHDHGSCIDTTLAAVQTHCAEHGLQFTPVRRRVLEILLQEHRAMGAYDILPILGEEGLGKQPPVVYRALEFLTTNGFVHKIERLNAYVACMHPGTEHAPAFMICRECSRVVETESRPGVGLNAAAHDLGFAIEATVIEAEGLCPNCRPAQ
ncbi:transcriptional repressor [Cognatishimia maritima]|uniref:Fur family transcriptional regulator, zinc uptake regulator n=1 Tax=Cognatishimia maritima TaxID=870908 RepID=A0A1M5T622_9RHOB|nr:transcriptional repressor [Cognatishimia maritima]SHH46189.1 Fur family transcriptional regulator, zinc uptake regulator [Cognatishimia maritima]